jgi:oligopeptide/dipeptide ABC transporter ATP-binding protein
MKMLEIKDLHCYFSTKRGLIRAVDGVSFGIDQGQTLGIVGESGSGKSITSLSILRLLTGTTGRILGGKIIFNGTDLLSYSEKQMRKIRGNNISMIFQEPMTSLNPTITIGEQIAETIRIHQNASRAEAWRKVVDMLNLVGIPEASKRARQYPYQMSGGMRQRVMIAIALACNPDLLIADEPTTALDVTIQAQILSLVKRLQRELGSAMIMITHDLGVIFETCDYVAVMYCGKIVEYASVKDLFEKPTHPYTIGLLKSIPSHEKDTDEDLYIIEGQVPSPYELPDGCAFAPRCPYAGEICAVNQPVLTTLEDGRMVSCNRVMEEAV